MRPDSSTSTIRRLFRNNTSARCIYSQDSRLSSLSKLNHVLRSQSDLYPQAGVLCMSVVRLSVNLRLVNEGCTTVCDSSPAVSTQSRPQQCRLSLQSRLACVQLIQAQSAVTHWRLGEARRGVDPEARPSGPTRSGPNPAHCAVVAAVSSGVPSAPALPTRDSSQHRARPSGAPAESDRLLVARGEPTRRRPRGPAGDQPELRAAI